jgi:hypothetical protein
MTRKLALSCIAAFACFGAPTAAFAEEWHVCITVMNNPEKTLIHYMVTPVFDVSSIPNW